MYAGLQALELENCTKVLSDFPSPEEPAIDNRVLIPGAIYLLRRLKIEKYIQT